MKSNTRKTVKTICKSLLFTASMIMSAYIGMAALLAVGVVWAIYELNKVSK